MGSGWFGLLAAGVAGIAVAQAPASPPQGPLKDPGQKTVRIVRTTVKPTIDGIVNEAEWAGAARVDDLYQVNPVEYASASERSEIYLFYDDNALYVAAKMFAEPGARPKSCTLSARLFTADPPSSTLSPCASAWVTTWKYLYQ